jgi:hypothetical protein
MNRLTTLAVLVAAGCGSSQEAIEVPLPVVASADGMVPAQSDDGYQIAVTRARAALSDLELTVGGESHDVGALAALWGLVIGTAHAHPGHASGGEVTGAMPGPFAIDWMEDGAALGTATLLEGDYEGCNFTFRRDGADHGLPGGDPLIGHTFAIEGTAEKDGDTIRFDALVDVDDGTVLVGAPFVLEVRSGVQRTLALEMDLTSPVDGKHVFAGVDFAALDEDGDGEVAIRPGDAAHNILRRSVQVHDFYRVAVR